MMKKIILIVLIVCLCASASALVLSVTPAQNATVSVDEKYCSNSDGAPYVFNITSQDEYGILCWYYTSEDSTKKQLTPSCLRPGNQGTYTAKITPPSPGNSKTVEIQLECYNFGHWTVGGYVDDCQDEWANDYSAAIAAPPKSGGSDPNHTIGGYPGFAPRYAEMECPQTSITVTTNPSSFDLIVGESSNSTLIVKNNGSNTVTCQYKSGNADWSSLGSVLPGSTNSTQSIKITAPSEGIGQTTNTVSVKCTDNTTSLSSQGDAVIAVSYSADPVQTALNNAVGMINDATQAIVNAQAEIQAATSAGGDITSAQNKLNQAQAYLDTAKSQKTTAQSTRSESEANKAYASAQTSKTYATEALNEANNAVQKVLVCKQDASNLIDEANTAISAAEAEVERADAVAVEQKISTVLANASLETARGNILDAESYLENASLSLDSGNCETAKTNANSAISKAQKAEQAAEKVAEDFQSESFKEQIIASELGNAQTEISKAEQTYQKLTVVVKGMENYSDVSSVLEQIGAEKIKLDNAKDYRSDAENRSSAGYSDEALNKAVLARDTAASAKNKLDRIVENLKNTILDDLDKSFVQLEEKILNADQTIQNATSTFGATPEKITDAQNLIRDAKSKVEIVKATIAKAKKASSLNSLLNESASAFELVAETEETTQSASNSAESAVSDATATAIGTGALAVAIGGGGFLYWKRKKKKGEKPGKKEGVIKKLKKKFPCEIKEQEKGKKGKASLCPSCKTKVGKGHKFCPNCGKNVE